MKTTENINIIECFDQNGDPVKYVCDGHVDSETFRESCYREFYVKPLVIQHQWRRFKKFVERQPEKKRTRFYTGNVHAMMKGKDGAPITVGLV